MGNRFLEAGKIVNAHGIHGEVKILPWADSPDFISGVRHFYIDGAPVRVLAARVHKGCVIAAFDGVSDKDGAMRLKDKIVFIDKHETRLEEGRHFVADLKGLRALDADTGEQLGILTDVLTLPANDVYVIQGSREILVPAAPGFIDEVNVESGYIKIRVIEGL
jgi:16S rRNA processing protein RimM